MKIAIISDIHSNIYALREVIDDIKNRDVDLTVCLGDLVGYATFPNEVIELIKEENILTIMGNYDDAVGNIKIVCGCDYKDPIEAENAATSLSWTIENTREENRKYLRDLPRSMNLTFGKYEITFVHGSPRKINEYLKESSKEAKEVMESFKGDILVCAHTHKPYYKMYEDKMIVNAGSVGKPKDGTPFSNYVIMNIEREEVQVEIIEKAYDFEKTAKAIDEVGLPKEFSQIIRTGKV